MILLSLSHRELFCNLSSFLLFPKHLFLILFIRPFMVSHFLSVFSHPFLCTFSMPYFFISSPSSFILHFFLPRSHFAHFSFTLCFALFLIPRFSLVSFALFSAPSLTPPPLHSRRRPFSVPPFSLLIILFPAPPLPLILLSLLHYTLFCTSLPSPPSPRRRPSSVSLRC